MEAKKAAVLKEKTRKARQLFNFPESEEVIQDYTCIWGVGKGRMYITQNYVGWASDITSFVEKFPFRNITNVKATRSLGLIGNAITIETTQKTIDLTGFVHRDEAFNLLVHLWKYPPTFVTTKAPPSQPRQREQDMALEHAPQAKAVTDGGGLGGSGGWAETGGGGGGGGGGNKWGDGGLWGTGGGSGRATYTSSSKGESDSGGGWGSSQKQKLTARDVDTASSENALRVAYEARNLGVDTMVELEVQANQIDRIENKVENIHNNLDKGDRLLRDIESLGGHIYNGMTKGKKENYIVHPDREVKWKTKRAEKLDIPILFKHTNDLLSPAYLHCEENMFSVIMEGQNKPAKGQVFSYDDVDRLLVRSRPLHLDIRFHGKGDRVRLASSLIQAIVNEMYYRVPASKVDWETEDIKKFEYGSEKIVINTKSRVDSGGAGGGSSGGGGSFFGVKKSTADLLSDDVDEDVKQAVRQQEDHLHEIGQLVNEMGQISVAMGSELDRQNAQLTRITDRVEQANERMHNTTNRIDRI